LINETVSAPTITPFFKGYLELKVTSAQGDTTLLVNLTNNNQVFAFVYRKTPSGIVVDPNNWIINKTGTITNAAIVPVKLISFEGKSTKDCAYELQWSTQEEFNVARYEIEASTNGMDFIKQMNISANTVLTGNYHYTINGLSANKYYFRLKIIEKDGNYTYSKIICLQSECYTNFNVTLSPNPVNDLIHLSVWVPTNQYCTVSILNCTGQVIRKERIVFSNGKNEYNISNLHRLAAGTYILQIINEEGIKISKEFLIKGR
jgi:hypothetical protein